MKLSYQILNTSLISFLGSYLDTYYMLIALKKYIQCNRTLIIPKISRDDQGVLIRLPLVSMVSQNNGGHEQLWITIHILIKIL